MNKLKINSIDIRGIGPIRHLDINFDPHFNVICGANGVGKTTILDCIAQSFTLNRWGVRCNAAEQVGNWKLKFDLGNQQNQEFNHETRCKYLNEDASNGFGLHRYADSVLVFKVTRSMSYVVVDSIKKDPAFNSGDLGIRAAVGADYNQIKQWLVNRYLWSAQVDALDAVQISNLERAKKCFTDVNKDFKFKKIDPSNNDIIIDTPQGAIELEQLSAGYIAMLIVLLGIIKEVEYRFKEPKVKVEDFSGVLILDEMDVHLHPMLQAQMYVALKSLLPNAQVITSTHSPHIIQVVKPFEIIPLVREGVEVRLNPLVNQEYGCQGWTVEEVLEDVMGMKEPRTEEFSRTMDEFKLGVKNEDANAVSIAYAKLDRMLHPQSVLREVLKIQKIGIRND